LPGKGKREHVSKKHAYDARARNVYRSDSHHRRGGESQRSCTIVQAELIDYTSRVPVRDIGQDCIHENEQHDFYAASANPTDQFGQHEIANDAGNPDEDEIERSQIQVQFIDSKEIVARNRVDFCKLGNSLAESSVLRISRVVREIMAKLGGKPNELAVNGLRTVIAGSSIGDFGLGEATATRDAACENAAHRGARREDRARLGM
jgi:hypothetical protein